MRLYAQHGYGAGDKIEKGLEYKWINGVIYSPKDYSKSKLEDVLRRLEKLYPESDRLVDPQFYASVIAQVDGARLGKLSEEEYEYFEARRRRQLESEGQVIADLKNALCFQLSLPVSYIIAPNIIIRGSLNSIESVIGKNFIRNTAKVWKTVGDNRPIYATLAIDAQALQDRYELEEFLTDITLLDDPPDGFYLLIHHDSAIISNELIDARTFAGWLLLNYSLKVNGFRIINGFSDILTPFLGAVGGDAGATGWYNNLKKFTLERFGPSIGGGQQPTPRYLSLRLLKSIRFDELQRLRQILPDILNILESDSYYTTTVKPQNRTDEMLQTWDVIRHMNALMTSNDIRTNLDMCTRAIAKSEALYSQVNAYPGLQLRSRSNDAHLYSFRHGLQLFSELAEINFTANE